MMSLGGYIMYHIMIHDIKVWVEDECTVILEIFQHDHVYESNILNSEEFTKTGVHFHE